VCMHKPGLIRMPRFIGSCPGLGAGTLLEQ
jgi:hypothetical protein